jgi:hypothetical protein
VVILHIADGEDRPVPLPDEHSKGAGLLLTTAALVIASVFLLNGVAYLSRWRWRIFLLGPLVLAIAIVSVTFASWGSRRMSVSPLQWWRDTTRHTRDETRSQWRAGGRRRARLIFDGPAAIFTIVLTWIAACVVIAWRRTRGTSA